MAGGVPQIGPFLRPGTVQFECHGHNDVRVRGNSRTSALCRFLPRLRRVFCCAWCADHANPGAAFLPLPPKAHFAVEQATRGRRELSDGTDRNGSLVRSRAEASVDRRR